MTILTISTNPIDSNKVSLSFSPEKVTWIEIFTNQDFDWYVVEWNLHEVVLPSILGIVFILLLLTFCITCIKFKYRWEFFQKLKK